MRAKEHVGENDTVLDLDDWQFMQEREPVAVYKHQQGQKE